MPKTAHINSALPAQTGAVPAQTGAAAAGSGAALPGRKTDPSAVAESTRAKNGADAAAPVGGPDAPGPGASAHPIQAASVTAATASVVAGQATPGGASAGAVLAGQPGEAPASSVATSAPVQPGVAAADPSSAPPGVVPLISHLLTPPSVPILPAASLGGPAASPSFPVAMHQQVFAAVSPLVRGGDGSYRVQLQLHPADLGAVQVNVQVRHGEISIQMNAADPAAREAIRGALSDLRQQLEDQGLRAGSMEVGAGGANPRQRETSWSRSQAGEASRHDSSQSDKLAATAGAASSSALDLRM
ncbi:MAG TPA: flagellar hook-length control protein FliK [Dermatophilaceae bacterium]